MAYELTQEKINQITQGEVLYGTTVLLPDRESIPEEFTDRENKWVRLFNGWFFNGLTSLKVTMNPSFEEESALACVRAHMGSRAPKHEHKSAGVAYMMSILFKDAKWGSNS